MYYNYNIVSIRDNGVQTYCKFESTTGYRQSRERTTPMGAETVFDWIIQQDLGTQIIVFDKCPVTTAEINQSVQNILAMQTELEWIGIV